MHLWLKSKLRVNFVDEFGQNKLLLNPLFYRKQRSVGKTAKMRKIAGFSFSQAVVEGEGFRPHIYKSGQNAWISGSQRLNSLQSMCKGNVTGSLKAVIENDQ